MIRVNFTSRSGLDVEFILVWLLLHTCRSRFDLTFLLPEFWKYQFQSSWVFNTNAIIKMSESCKCWLLLRVELLKAPCDLNKSSVLHVWLLCLTAWLTQLQLRLPERFWNQWPHLVCGSWGKKKVYTNKSVSQRLWILCTAVERNEVTCDIDPLGDTRSSGAVQLPWTSSGGQGPVQGSWTCSGVHSGNLSAADLNLWPNRNDSRSWLVWGFCWMHAASWVLQQYDGMKWKHFINPMGEYLIVL